MESGRLSNFAAGALAGAALSAATFYWLCRTTESAAPPSRSKSAGSSGGAPPAAGAASAAAPRPAPLPHALADFDQDDILSEQLTRNVQFFGLEAQKRIGRAFVVVVGLGVRLEAAGSRRPRASGAGRGCLHAWAAQASMHLARTASALEWVPKYKGAAGAIAARGQSPPSPRRARNRPTASPQGVGSHAAHMLLRSGVGRLRLVDFDQVRAGLTAARGPAGLTASHWLPAFNALKLRAPRLTCLHTPRLDTRTPGQVTLSSLNRHAVAVRADVGISKAACLERHFREILPEVTRGARGDVHAKPAEGAGGAWGWLRASPCRLAAP
jgi:hypothetical protein